MAPVELRYERGEFMVVHECTGCGIRRRNRTAVADDLDTMFGASSPSESGGVPP